MFFLTFLVAGQTFRAAAGLFPDEGHETDAALFIFSFFKCVSAKASSQAKLLMFIEMQKPVARGYYEGAPGLFYCIKQQ